MPDTPGGMASSQVADARAAHSAAHAALARIQNEVTQLQLDSRCASRFCALCDTLCHGDVHLAHHIWSACLLDGTLSCALHLDELDISCLLNTIVSLGVRPDGGIVQLRGSYLMLVVAYCDANLADSALSDELPFAHDSRGNIVLVDPPSIDLTAPSGRRLVDVPANQVGVRQAIRDGKTILVFYSSGGVVASQLAHHYHAVVSCLHNVSLMR